MSSLPLLKSKPGLKEAESIILAYPAKSEYEVVPYERDTVIHYCEKIAGLKIPFKVTFCRQKFATIGAGPQPGHAAAASFTALKSAYEALKSEAETLYGLPHWAKADCESYEELVRLDLRSTMTSGLPDDRYVAIREAIWKIGSDAANRGLL